MAGAVAPNADRASLRQDRSADAVPEIVIHVLLPQSSI
jgi:hypothetical protein